MSDYIKREDVVERLSRTFLLQAPTARAIVEAIPTANVVERNLYERALSDVIDLSMKRKTGKWIYIFQKDDVSVTCSNCGMYEESFGRWIYDDGYRVVYNYCPYCGAEMTDV